MTSVAGGKTIAGGVVLVDDQSPYSNWVLRGKRIENGMNKKFSFGYQLFGNNSNSWAMKLIKELGLRGAFDCAMKKRERAGHEWPIFPGLEMIHGGSLA